MGRLWKMLSAALVALATVAAAPNNDFDYKFGRPITPTEHTYAWYRRTQADAAAKRGLDPKAVGDGMDTWHWWTGVDNPGFWRDLAKLTGNKHNYTGLNGDILRILMETPRRDRFKVFGMINDPDCVAADAPDQFGLTLDRMKDGTLTWDPDVFGYSSGVIGLQIFKNADFDRSKWSLAKYRKDPTIEPPYKVGMACVFCHVGFDPNHPPQNLAEPKWDNIVSAIGNQYLHEGTIFSLGQTKRSMIYQYLVSQEPGTSETSRFPSDFINNPTNINSIFRLQDRLQERTPERITPAQKALIEAIYKDAGIPTNAAVGSLGGTESEPTISVPHILTDGADSMGVVMASVRVYINEGMMHSQWYSSWPVDPFHMLDSVKSGFAPKEFDIATARKDPNSPWMQTERRMPNMATFLSSVEGYPLAATPEGRKFLKADSTTLATGKMVFADNCAGCHSSKKPSPMPDGPEQQRAAWRQLVAREDFLDHNYLSDDQRHSLDEIGTNAQRAEGTNAQGGWTWGQMSSQTYKDLRAVTKEVTDRDEHGKPRPLYNPLTHQYDITWKGPAGYYRTPTLVSIWATAPFLHNNSVGIFNNDPSIKGRLAAFDDAIDKLLTPSHRLGVRSIKVTSSETDLPDMFPVIKAQFPSLADLELEPLTFPKGTPINLLMNVPPKAVPELLEAYVGGVLDGEPRQHLKGLISRRRSAGMKALTKKLLEVNSCPDFIEDRGHTFGQELSRNDKKALAEYMKTF